MNLGQAAVNLMKSQEKIDRIISRLKELKAERELYAKKFEFGDIGSTLYGMRMTPIHFEIGLLKNDYRSEVIQFNKIRSAYDILKAFDNIGEDENINDYQLNKAL
jgi:hypothetical protein